MIQVDELQSFAQIDLTKGQLTDLIVVQDEFLERGEPLELESMNINNIIEGEI